MRGGFPEAVKHTSRRHRLAWFNNYLDAIVQRDLQDNRKLLGELLESFVFAEIRKQTSWQLDRVDVLHFRDKKRKEVDIEITNRQRNLVGVEVKAAASVSAKDFKGFKVLARDAGRKFRCGIVLYDGERTLAFGDKFSAVPFAALWNS